ncbi:conserved membrane protein of unknown function [Candidatus Filomicrobium marinum]|uniref:Probable membrane transporter protein n=2 Tax=Candidatus Filomicrobium marinum TaxID=1608628 RepID=A0A0D6JIV9_9HYPH|nr:conserved membrane protein of unknown function [Candidatus Filomicrobium marinum]CPR21909.1 conserved membrane protein of unknown function [Candidatus Filomicrobium marinum]
MGRESVGDVGFMDIGMTWAGFSMLAFSLLAAGVIVGFLSGLLGIGGGGILVPVLYETFAALGVDPAIRMHMAIGTSLAVIIPTSLRALMAHSAKGVVDWVAVRRIGPWIVIGVVLGIMFADQVTGTTLKWVWVVFGTLFAAKMAFGRDTWRLGHDLPALPKLEIFSVLVGIISVLMSIGGAAFIVTFLTLYGRPILTAVATSSAIGPLIAIPGAIGMMWAGWGHPGLPPLSLGFVSLLGAALIVPSSVLVAPVGVRLAHGVSRRKLELAFAVFLVVIVLRFLSSLILE